jgi:hypothetical protein
MGDKYLWLELSRICLIGYIDSNTTVYRVRDNTASSFNDRGKRNSFINTSFEMAFHFMDKYGCSSKTKQVFYNRAIKTSFERKQKKMFRKVFRRKKEAELLNSNDYLLRIFISFNLFYYSLKLTRKIKRLFIRTFKRLIHKNKQTNI